MADKNYIEEVINIVASKLGIDKKKITAETRILEDLHADSLDMIEMITEMEEHFKISITDEQIASMKTVGDVAKFCIGNKKK